MTFKQVAKMIRDIGLPYSYYQFDNGTAVPPPFICYFYEGGNDVLADNSNYQKVETLVIELYTDAKDFAHEAAIESALNGAGLVYSREETFIDSEKMYEIIFTCGVVITEG
jgi:hypothetical protein